MATSSSQTQWVMDQRTFLPMKQISIFGCDWPNLIRLLDITYSMDIIASRQCVGGRLLYPEVPIKGNLVEIRDGPRRCD